jgi:hypothetical protein
LDLDLDLGLDLDLDLGLDLDLDLGLDLDLDLGLDLDLDLGLDLDLDLGLDGGVETVTPCLEGWDSSVEALLPPIGGEKNCSLMTEGTELERVEKGDWGAAAGEESRTIPAPAPAPATATVPAPVLALAPVPPPPRGGEE